MAKIQIKYVILPILFIAVIFSSCSIKYGFTTVNLPTDVKTYSVAYFPNRSKLINPTLSQQLTESLKEKLQKQTSLNETEESGDLEYSGTITNYEVRPVSIQKGDLAAQNRLTITISLKFTNNIEHEQDFERNFSAFADYESTAILSDVEEDLVTEILDKILEDIFNATVANW
ncbi:MAG: LptE family protein [Prolixibacteraceae bacterium]|nr:LptE family protein [Prolixibacteraceae bacterium]